METINPEFLNSDLHYRFDYIRKFIDFKDEDVAIIKTIAPKLTALIPTFVDELYSKMLSFDLTRSVFLLPEVGFKGKLETNIGDVSPNSDIIKFRKDFLTKYFIIIMTGNWDNSMISYLDYVGKIHTNKVGVKNLYVDYIHVNAAFGLLSYIIHKGIHSLNLEKEVEYAAVSSFNKILWLQNDLFARWYIESHPADEHNSHQSSDVDTKNVAKIKNKLYDKSNRLDHNHYEPPVVPFSKVAYVIGGVAVGCGLLFFGIKYQFSK